jgi:hypothetical protein
MIRWAMSHPSLVIAISGFNTQESTQGTPINRQEQTINRAGTIGL